MRHSLRTIESGIAVMPIDQPIPTRKDIIRSYNLIVGGIDEEASSEEQERAYGGVVRMAKGKMLESITKHLVRIAWNELGQDDFRLSIGNERNYKIHIQNNYIKSIKDKSIQKYIFENHDQYFYRAQVDVHVFIDNVFVLGIECKAYAENAMLKRILVDFMLLRHKHKNLACCLMQMESQLGGDYSKPLLSVKYGSESSHTLMSFFKTVDLQIVTLLEGERRVDKPIHKPEHFKSLNENLVNAAIAKLKDLLSPYIKPQKRKQK